MRRILTIIALAGAAAYGLLFAQGGASKPEKDTKIIDLMADVVYPIPVGDSTATTLVGNFAAQHNGAVITCDSAVRYSDKRIEFFGNVLINKNTTYIYGDRAIYDGERNEAQVFSDLIKVVDEDATLYTYKFLFNTKTNIGVFDYGGYMTNRDSRMESVRGYYYADSKELVCVEQVEMRNDEYELKGDSVIYNMGNDHAYFFERTNIWSKDGDYLYADKGQYSKIDSLYSVTNNGYVLTEKQEVWSDSLDYFQAKGHIILYQDIQIDDTEHKVLAFGDYGEYWENPGNAFLTRRPSVISYDAEQGDSLFMRADSIYLFTRNTAMDRAEAAARAADSVARVADSVARTKAVDSLGRTQAADSLGRGSRTRPDSLNRGQHASGQEGGSASAESAAKEPDSGKHNNTADPTTVVSGETAPAVSDDDKRSAADSLVNAPSVDSLARDRTDSLAREAADTLTQAERKALLKVEAAKAKAEQKKAAAIARKERLDSIGAERQAKINAKLLAQKEKEEARLQAQRLKIESKFKAKQARAARKGKVVEIDSAALRRIDAQLEQNSLQQDSLAHDLGDSLLQDSTSIAPRDSLDSLSGCDSLDSLGTQDSLDSAILYRLVKAFHNVRIYRKDFQTVCDSLTAISTDSTIHLYINPVLWNENNQVISDVMDIYTVNQQITKADFVGSPMMISQLDTMRYNQVAGNEMTAHFRNSEIYRNDVNGNARTIYYMQDGDTEDIVMMGVVDSGNITFFIEDKQVEGITYRINPVYTFYPIDKIPEDVDTRLKGFKWEGERRPTQATVFDRRIRPSERERRSELRHPDFPIMYRIEDHKKRLLDQRRWSDRDDVVTPQVDEWMRSLGFPTGQPRPQE